MKPPNAEMIASQVKALLGQLKKALGVEAEEITGTGASEGKLGAPNLPAQAPSAREVVVTVADLIPHRPPDFSATSNNQTISIAGGKIGMPMLTEITEILRDRLGVPRTDFVQGVIVLHALELYLDLLRTATAESGEPEDLPGGRYGGAGR